MASLPSNNDFDVPLDWLYKGKRKNKIKPIINSTNSVSPNSTNIISNNTSNENSQSSTTATTSATATTTTTDNNITATKPRSNLIDKRTRSSSLSYGTSSNSLNSKNIPSSLPSSRTENGNVTTTSSTTGKTGGPPNTSVVRSRSLSMSQIANTRNNLPSSTVNNKPKKSLPPTNNNSEGKKKSLLSSLFGRRTSISFTTATTATTTTTTKNNTNSTHVSNKKETIHLPHITTSTISIDNCFDTNTVGNNVPFQVGSPDFNSYASPILTSPLLQQQSPRESNITPTENLPSSKSTLDQLLNIPLKRVTFAVDKFEGDPPQQLPSRQPKIGNVLIPEDMISDIPSISVGITNTDDGNNHPQVKITKDSKEYKHALEVYNQNLKESIKHQQEAHKAAEKMAKEVKSFNEKLSRKNSLSVTKEQSSVFSDSNENSDTGNSNGNVINDEDPTNDNSTFVDMSNIDIDKGINIHEHYFQQSEESETSSVLTLDIIYTRCCHLREILPIPSTFRQLKGKTAPLRVLKFLNPRPTLIDILSFCDFIAIVPIHNVIFDNVTLNSEMLRIVLSSLVNSTTLEKIGLKNVVITQKDWPFFCKFLFRNKSLTKVDISQTKVRSGLSLKDHREYMDWDLLINVIRQRKGKPLEELLLNGIKLNNIPLPQFRTLLTVFGEKYKQFYSEATSGSITSPTNVQFRSSNNMGIRLGLAATGVTEDYLATVLTWLSQYSVQGVDLSFNNLNPFLRTIAKRFSKLPFENLQYFTFNNTSISNVTDLALVLKYLSRLPNVKYLDLSNIPDVFPGIIPYLYKYLPRFPNLKRIHIDSNNLIHRQIIMLCGILVKCKSLSHVSLLYDLKNNDANKVDVYNDDTINTNNYENNLGDNKSINRYQIFTRNTVWATLYALVRDSPNLFSLDIDYDQVSDEIQSRIALCLMRNMQHAVNADFQIDALSSQDQLLFDGTLMAETADDVLKKLNSNTLMDKDPHLIAAKKYMLKKYFEKLEVLLQNVQDTIDNVFEKRKTGELPSKEKENLLRLLLLEKNLKNIIELVSPAPNVANSINDSFVSSVTNEIGQSMTSSGMVRPSLKHLDSARLIAEVVREDDHESNSTVPHTVATEGNNKIVDTNTGRPILYKSPSSRSLQNKLQEKEEGELHKWGFFVQQQRSIYPSDKPLSGEDFKVSNKGKVNDNVNIYPSDQDNYVSQLSTLNLESGSSTPLSPKILSRIPSGEELRKAIINAKGTSTMDEWIQNVASNKQELEKIYNAAYFLTGQAKVTEDNKNEEKK